MRWLLATLFVLGSAVPVEAQISVFTSQAAPGHRVVVAGAVALHVQQAGDTVRACAYRLPGSPEGILAGVSEGRHCARATALRIDAHGDSRRIFVRTPAGEVQLSDRQSAGTLEFRTQRAAWRALAALGHALGRQHGCSPPRQITIYRGTQELRDPAFVSVRCRRGFEMRTGQRRLDIVQAVGLGPRDTRCSDFADAPDFELVNFSTEGGLCFRDFMVDRYDTAEDIRARFGERCTADSGDVVCDGVRFTPGQYASRST